MIFLTTILPVLKGLFSILWDVLKTPINIPIGIILLALIIGVNLKNTAVERAVREKVLELVAGAELKARDIIIENQQLLLEEKNKQIQEQQILINIHQEALNNLEEQLQEDELKYQEALDKINELSNIPPEACYVDDTIIDRLRNQ